MRKVLAIILLCCTAFPLLAAEPPESRHQVRVGWGDMFFERLAFHSTVPGTYGAPESLPASFVRTETFDYGYTGHIYAEYSYRYSSLLSFGLMADLEGIFWKKGDFDRYHQLKTPATQVNNWDLVIMPTVRFTYLRKPMVRLYSGVGLGALFAWDNAGGFRMAPSINLNWIGVEVGKGHWGFNAELGMLNSLTGAYHIYQLGSRLISFGAYYKW